jgi:hypothetical protein
LSRTTLGRSGLKVVATLNLNWGFGTRHVVQEVIGGRCS